MRAFSRNVETVIENVIKITGLMAVAVALFLAVAISPAAAQDRVESVWNGHKIIYPASSIEHPGRMHTNYFYVDSDQPQNKPPSGAENPASVACVYQLVEGLPGCPIKTSTALPTGGWGAIAIVDAGDYPNAASDLAAFDSYYGIAAADLTVTWPGHTKPPVYADWETEEALDIEWAHAMAPQAKLYLVESVQVDTDPTWAAVQLAAQLVAAAGGGVVSMSWGDKEVSAELGWDKYFVQNGVVFFAASGDSGLGVSIYPGASPNVVSVGGTYFTRDGSGNFTDEKYDSGGGGDISPFEPRPSYQSGVVGVVGAKRGYPDVTSNFCCAAIYLNGSWTSVGGTSWASPTFAGIVNAAGSKELSTSDQLTLMYGVLANASEYAVDYYDITEGSTKCGTGFDKCSGIGSPRTYAGK
jgi:subtilase family serine protease